MRTKTVVVSFERTAKPRGDTRHTLNGLECKKKVVVWRKRTESLVFFESMGEMVESEVSINVESVESTYLRD